MAIFVVVGVAAWIVVVGIVVAVIVVVIGWSRSLNHTSFHSVPHPQDIVTQSGLH